MYSLWEVKKEQMNGPAQMAFKFMKLNASQVKHRWALWLPGSLNSAEIED